jgi:RNA polymerase-binding transcription factor DksA
MKPNQKVVKTEKQKKKLFSYYPLTILKDVSAFLQENLSLLEKRKEELDSEDPFHDTDRLNDNASADTEAEEQFGHARTSAIREQLDRKIIQTRKALTMIKIGKYGLCEDCGKMIDTDRLIIYPEATLCADCQKSRE